MKAQQESLLTGPDRPPLQGWRWVRLRALIREAQSGFACGQRDPEGVVQLRMNNVDTRTPEDLMAIIEAKGLEVAEALLMLRASR